MTALHSRVRDWTLFLSVAGILAFIALQRRHSAFANVFRSPATLSTDRSSAVGRRLHAVQLGVLTFPRHEFVVGAYLNEARAVQNKN
jgi:hypothetical protein